MTTDQECVSADGLGPSFGQRSHHMYTCFETFHLTCSLLHLTSTVPPSPHSKLVQRHDSVNGWVTLYSGLETSVQRDYLPDTYSHTYDINTCKKERSSLSAIPQMRMGQSFKTGSVIAITLITPTFHNEAFKPRSRKSVNYIIHVHGPRR